MRVGVCITKREKAESEAQRGKPKGTVRWRAKFAMRYRSEESAAARYWCGNVVIDRGDQLGKVLERDVGLY